MLAQTVLGYSSCLVERVSRGSVSAFVDVWRRDLLVCIERHVRFASCIHLLQGYDANHSCYAADVESKPDKSMIIRT